MILNSELFIIGKNNKKLKIIKTVNRECPVCSGDKIKELNIVNNIKIVRCINCKMVFADVENSEIDEKNIYTEESFYKYIANEPVYSLAYYDLILEKIQKHFKKKDVKILEFGCGPGFFLRRAKLKNIDAYGCDFSSYSQLAKETFNLNIKVAGIFDAGYKKNEFDVVITHATHEHLSNMYEISENLYQILKPGGIYIISGVPNYNTIPIKVFSNFFKNAPPSHVNFFEKKSLVRFYKKLNLRPISIRTYGISTWTWSILMKIKEKLRKNKNKESIQQTVNKKNISEQKISKIHKIIAKMYIYFHIPGMGRNIEIWGLKEND